MRVQVRPVRLGHCCLDAMLLRCISICVPFEEIFDLALGAELFTSAARERLTFSITYKSVIVVTYCFEYMIVLNCCDVCPCI